MHNNSPTSSLTIWNRLLWLNWNYVSHILHLITLATGLSNELSWFGASRFMQRCENFTMTVISATAPSLSPSACFFPRGPLPNEVNAQPLSHREQRELESLQHRLQSPYMPCAALQSAWEGIPNVMADVALRNSQSSLSFSVFLPPSLSLSVSHHFWQMQSRKKKNLTDSVLWEIQLDHIRHQEATEQQGWEKEDLNHISLKVVFATVHRLSLSVMVVGIALHNYWRLHYPLTFFFLFSDCYKQWTQ